MSGTGGPARSLKRWMGKGAAASQAARAGATGSTMDGEQVR